MGLCHLVMVQVGTERGAVIVIADWYMRSRVISNYSWAELHKPGLA